MSTQTSDFRKVTTKSLQLMKQQNIKIAAITAYDFLFAKLVDRAGIDLILVGDSLGNVFQGNETTLPVTIEEMIYHTKAVMKGVNRAMVICDMPFMSYQTNPDDAFRNAGRIMKETNAGGVKVEGGISIAETIYKITCNGIPVMGHVGLMPQSIHQYGSYKARGVDEKEAQQIINDAKAVAEAGAFAIVLEKIPAQLAKKITESVNVPTIGIGAGKYCDGQILVLHDMLGLNEEFKPRFVRKYLNLAQEIDQAIKNYVSDIKTLNFPSEKESY
ncbi:MAG TPA: 3-methyl-2-oxobutanoate hydroxymethyltransferase [Ignavibacteriales bacterium]|nr:3-methyl-2-oxobutanoate hydroxymethyltransferase [Ignavibacteriales bacterium]HOL80217.1 3-methyl-2-oxobutanoate hydroxymethyltransferase [Ignavibacteriales bacterium]HOM64498.1 3-methyl-2-oxobutanoate hydroxymethyltransferase [Ignavibacteriales bacterium]HPD66595.1 3-methyl-2-oxobutanoate hydroxymethyltransferase [Ignavibacteriales bacterium]HPP32406.1 3-methyl-2-oxobutanoate hydroxymethyltransferase [Ignavibacteriales bacterium]